MNRIKRWKMSCFLAAVFVLLACTVALAAQKADPVVDKAGILKEADVQRLSKKIQEVETKHGVRLGIRIEKSVKGSVGKAANHLLDEKFSNAKNGGMVLLLAMESRDWYISTNNEMRRRITDDNGMPYLKDQFLGNLKEKDYAGAFEKYVDTADVLLTYYEQQGKPYDPSDEFSFLALLAAVVMSGIGGWMVRAGLISSMSNVTQATEAGTYLERESVRLHGNSDTFLFMNVTRTPKSKKSDSGMDTSARDDDHGGGGGKF